MTEPQVFQLRAKILGVLLRDARLAAGKSMKDLGDIVGVSASTISSIERGSSSLSLPEVELLAFYLGMPITHFWSENIVSETPHPSENLRTEQLLGLRHRTIGALLRQARTERNLSQKELADQTGISSSRVRRYESGETPVPIPELESLAAVLDVSIDHFTDNNGPVGEWISKQRAAANVERMPAELRDFVSNPENRQYLLLAQKLKDISLSELRALAETLQSILE